MRKARKAVKKRAKRQRVTGQEPSPPLGEADAKKKLARRLLAEGSPKKEAEAVKLLEECVTLGDADAMMTLAKCYALGCGTVQDADRVDDLLSMAAEKGDKYAEQVLGFIRSWKRQNGIFWNCLLCFFMRALIHCSFVRLFTGDDTTNAGEDLNFTIACSFLNIVPCKSLHVNGEFMIPLINED